jgi:uncharacterized protein with GYD domain
MGRYLFQVSYSQEAWKSMVANPQNRLDAVKEMLSPHGITVVDGYATFGEYDLIAIFEAPDDKTVAAASILVSSSGSVSALKTTPLMPVDDLVDAMKIAKGMGYKPPTS